MDGGGGEFAEYEARHGLDERGVVPLVEDTVKLELVLALVKGGKGVQTAAEVVGGGFDGGGVVRDCFRFRNSHHFARFGDFLLAFRD